MSFLQKARDFYDLIQIGKMLEAIDSYYDENIKVIDSVGNIREGKDENTKYNTQFLREIEEIFGVEILSITSDEKRGISMVEYWIELKFKNGLKKKFEEITVQHWIGDKIIQERFYKSTK